MVVEHESESGKVTLNKKFEDFANYYGFKAKFCRPYRPQTKGKIESGVKYVKRNFVPGRRFKDLEHLNHELLNWIIGVSDQRIHGTTYKKPITLFEDEKNILIPINIKPYCYVPVIQSKVSHDSMISYCSNRYSIPWQYSGNCVDLNIAQGLLIVKFEGKVIATHELESSKHHNIVIKEHFHGLIKYNKKISEKNELPPQCGPYWNEYENEVEKRSLQIYESCTSNQSSMMGGVLC